MQERDFFTEKAEMKPMSLTCPQCRHRDDYQIKWLKRTKKERLPPGADERDRAMFGKVRDHLFRVDDMVNCTKCRRRFEIPSHQTMVFL
jgi:hypothetical protein